MNRGILKWIIVWNLVVTVLLLVTLAARAGLAEAAKEPPVQVFNSSLAVNGGATDQHTAEVPIQQTSYTPLAQVTVNLPQDKPHMCVANASAGAAHESGNGLYLVNLKRNGATLSVANRRFELIDNPGVKEPTYKEVSTLGAWTELTGANTITFSARKNSAADPDMTVVAASLNVYCVKKILG
jgi:hypothetical protein